MAFKTISNRFEGDFQEQLNALADRLKEAKLKKEAQIAPPPAPGSLPGSSGGDQKEQQIGEILNSITVFCDRLVKEWLHSIDETDLQEVKRVFDEINQLSAGDIQQVMGGNSSPFDLVASSFKVDGTDAGGDGKPCCGGEPEVVADIEIPMTGLNHQSNHGHSEGLPGAVA